MSVTHEWGWMQSSLQESNFATPKQNMVDLRQKEAVPKVIDAFDNVFPPVGSVFGDALDVLSNPSQK